MVTSKDIGGKPKGVSINSIRKKFNLSNKTTKG